MFAGLMLYFLAMFIIDGTSPICTCEHCSTAALSYFNLIVPFILSASMPMAGVALFYKIKLRTPLLQLKIGTKRITENDLDFSIQYKSNDELGKLCKSFESMRIELLKSNRELWQQMEERKRLNAAFAHDLRNPVTVLKGSAAILQKGIEKGDIKNAEENINLIQQYSARIENYIQAMTSIQKLEEIVLVPKETHWAILTKELKCSLSILCTTKEIVFLCNGENNLIHVDRYMIQDVTENLVSNAIRYAKNKIIVDMSCDNEKITMSVLDDGDGFSPAILKKGIAPFLRDDNAEPKDNFGIGLYVCDLLCRKHGGFLLLENYSNGAKVTAKFYF